MLTKMRLMRALAIAALGAGFIALSVESYAFTSTLVPGVLADLRAAQAQDLNGLRQSFHSLGAPQGSNSASVKFFNDNYNAGVQQVRGQYLSQDPRPAELKQLLSDYTGRLTNTGSLPKDIRADIDLAASDVATADEVAARWRTQYGADAIEKLPNGMGYVNHATDTTLWKPCLDQACKDALINYNDSFGTTGGRNGTGVPGEINDPYGFGLDNEKKFIDGLQSGDLKGVGKSVSKAGEASGLAITGDDPDFWAQAKALRDYGDPEQAGIVRRGASAAERQQAIADWQARAEQYMEDATKKLAAQGEELQSQRQAKIDDPATSPEERAALQNEIDQVNGDNIKAENINEEMRARVKGGNPEAADTHGASGEPEPTTTASADNPPAEAGAEAGSAAAEEAGAAAGTGSAWNAGEIQAGARSGAAVAAALTFTLCAAQSGLNRDAKADAQKIATCLKQAAEAAPEAAVLGAVAAMGPWGAGLVATYGAYQTAGASAEASAQFVKAVEAINQMDKAEAAAISWDVAQANFQNIDTATFILLVSTIERSVKDLESDGAYFAIACSGAKGSAPDSARAKDLNAKISAAGPGIVTSIRQFARLFPPNAMFSSLTLGWRSRVGHVTDAVAQNTSCLQSAAAAPPADQGGGFGLPMEDMTPEESRQMKCSVTQDCDSAPK